MLICCSTIKVGVGCPGYAALASSKCCACIFSFISPSHGVLYPALYFAYFHVLCLGMGIIQAFIGPEVCLGLCNW